MSYTVAGWIVRGAVVVALWLYGVRIARWRGNVATVTGAALIVAAGLLAVQPWL